MRWIYYRGFQDALFTAFSLGICGLNFPTIMKPLNFHCSTLLSGFLEYFVFSESLINVTGLFYLGSCVDRTCFHFSASIEESYGAVLSDFLPKPKLGVSWTSPSLFIFRFDLKNWQTNCCYQIWVFGRYFLKNKSIELVNSQQINDSSFSSVIKFELSSNNLNFFSATVNLTISQYL